MNEEEGIGRRRFQLTSIYALGAAIATALGIPAFSYLLVPQKRRRSGEWVDVADLSKLTVGTPEEVVFRRERVDGWKVTSEKTTAWIIKQPDGRRSLWRRNALIWDARTGGMSRTETSCVLATTPGFPRTAAF
jgi:hypothetical protein